MFALICGYLPFEDPNTANLYKKILNGEFSIPKVASDDAKDLIKNILQTNPEVRYRVQDIRKHQWYLSTQMDRIVGGIFIGLSQIPVSVQILDKLVGLNFKREYVIKCINSNKHNHATTSYYLLLKKAEKCGELDESQFQIFDDKKFTFEPAKQDDRATLSKTPDPFNRSQPVAEIIQAFNSKEERKSNLDFNKTQPVRQLTTEAQPPKETKAPPQRISIVH